MCYMLWIILNIIYYSVPLHTPRIEYYVQISLYELV